MKFSKLVTVGLVYLAALQGRIPQNPYAASVHAAQVSGETATLRAAVDRFCVTCHNSRVTSAATASGVVLDRADLNHVEDDPALWEKVARKLRTDAMPPQGAPRPDRATNDALVGFIE